MLSLVNSSSPILALGLEAADPDLLEAWLDAGELPNFRALIERGGYRRLRSCTDVSSGATWPSITTGVSPAKHGMGFYHRQLKSGTYRIIKKYADDVRSEFFWKPMSAAGRRVAIFDIPSIYPPPNFNGAQVVGWGAEGLVARAARAADRRHAQADADRALAAQARAVEPPLRWLSGDALGGTLLLPPTRRRPSST